MIIGLKLAIKANRRYQISLPAKLARSNNSKRSPGSPIKKVNKNSYLWLGRALLKGAHEIAKPANPGANLKKMKNKQNCLGFAILDENSFLSHITIG